MNFIFNLKLKVFLKIKYIYKIFESYLIKLIKKNKKIYNKYQNNMILL